MSTNLLLTVVAIAVPAATVAGYVYVRRSMRSFASAEFVRTKILDVTARELLATPGLPKEVAHLVLSIFHLAGCGCLIRGILLGRLMLLFTGARGDRERRAAQHRTDRAFSILERQDASVREKFGELIAYATIYDSFANPLQGWLFRHVLRTYMTPRPKLSPEEKLKGEMIAVSILRRGTDRNRLPLNAVSA